MASIVVEHEVDVFLQAIVGLIRRDGPDLTTRQLAVFLTCYRTSEAQTVRGLAEHLNVAKSAITRALDRLEGSDLIHRKDDPKDRRSILVRRTAIGRELHDEIITLIDAADKMADPGQPHPVHVRPPRLANKAGRFAPQVVARSDDSPSSRIIDATGVSTA